MQNNSLLKLSLAASALLLFSGAVAQPAIDSVSPMSGPPLTTVNITGSGFINTLYNNVVYFGAQQGIVMQASPTSLQVSVPYGATYAPISVTSGKFTAYSSQPFIPTFGSGGVPISTSTFPQRMDLPTGLNPIRAVVANLDREGGSDIAVVNNSNSPAATISVLLNTGGYVAPGQPGRHLSQRFPQHQFGRFDPVCTPFGYGDFRRHQRHLK